MKRQVNLALALGRHRRRVRPLLRRNMTKSPSQPISGCALTRQKLLHHLTDEREMLLCDAMRIIGSRDRAEDVVQDAAVRCLNSTSVSMDILNPRGFLRRIVRNLALDQLRRDKREQSVPLALDDDLPCDRPGAEQKLSDTQALQRFAEGLSKLPPRDSQIFLAHRLRFELQKDIALRFNLSPARVNGVISLAHLSLKAYMATGD